jgi:hypothetical protein
MADPDVLRFPFAFDRPQQLAGRAFGVAPGSAAVTVAGDRFEAVFGPWRVETTLDNIAGAEVTGPYSWWKVLGPARLSVVDRGLTFATNGRRGVCVRFHRPVRGVDPLGVVRHPALTVTVADAAGLAELLDHADAAGPGAVAAEVVAETADDLLSLSAHELRERARQLGISGVGSMKKADLVEALSHH